MKTENEICENCGDGKEFHINKYYKKVKSFRWRCSKCYEIELPSCEECGDELKEGDLIYCGVLGKHIHRDCLAPMKARVIK